MLLLTLIVVPLVVVDSPELRVDWTLTVVVAGDSVVDVDSVSRDVEVDNLVVVVSAP